VHCAVFIAAKSELATYDNNIICWRPLAWLWCSASHNSILHVTCRMLLLCIFQNCKCLFLVPTSDWWSCVLTWNYRSLFRVCTETILKELLDRWMSMNFSVLEQWLLSCTKQTSVIPKKLMWLMHYDILFVMLIMHTRLCQNYSLKNSLVENIVLAFVNQYTE